MAVPATPARRAQPQEQTSSAAAPTPSWLQPAWTTSSRAPPASREPASASVAMPRLPTHARRRVGPASPSRSARAAWVKLARRSIRAEGAPTRAPLHVASSLPRPAELPPTSTAARSPAEACDPSVRTPSSCVRPALSLPRPRTASAIDAPPSLIERSRGMSIAGVSAESSHATPSDRLVPVACWQRTRLTSPYPVSAKEITSASMRAA
jgi:hypothetical protein